MTSKPSTPNNNVLTIVIDRRAMPVPFSFSTEAKCASTCCPTPPADHAAQVSTK